MFSTLTNKNSTQVVLSSIGARIHKFLFQGEDMVLGLESEEDYYHDNYYFGCTLGRFANRIAGGKIKINSKEYSLSQNEDTTCLHGGKKGFDKFDWQIANQNSVTNSITYFRKSPSGEEGFPGELQTYVTYTLTNDDSLAITFEATTSESTVVNLANHAYFNLSGANSDGVWDHELFVNSDQVLGCDGKHIATGEFKSVINSNLDFKTPKKVFLGLDHCFVVNEFSQGKIRLAAKLSDTRSGRTLEVFTDQPGLQVYSGNFLDGKMRGKMEREYYRHHGICLEAQQFPNSPNIENFPSTVLNPGEKYKATTVYKFRGSK